MKVFGIGLAKTGTKSLARALQILGIDAMHCPGNLGHLEQHEGGTDTLPAIMYQDLFEMYTGSKFILTVREKSAWMLSAERHFSKPLTDAVFLSWNLILYRAETWNAKEFSAAFDRHILRVGKFFSDKPGSLLVMDLCGGDGWDLLCPFLDKARPQDVFPWII